MGSRHSAPAADSNTPKTRLPDSRDKALVASSRNLKSKSQYSSSQNPLQVKMGSVCSNQSGVLRNDLAHKSTATVASSRARARIYKKDFEQYAKSNEVEAGKIKTKASVHLGRGGAESNGLLPVTRTSSLASINSRNNQSPLINNALRAGQSGHGSPTHVFHARNPRGQEEHQHKRPLPHNQHLQQQNVPDSQLAGKYNLTKKGGGGHTSSKTMRYKSIEARDVSAVNIVLLPTQKDDVVRMPTGKLSSFSAVAVPLDAHARANNNELQKQPNVQDHSAHNTTNSSADENNLSNHASNKKARLHANRKMQRNSSTAGSDEARVALNDTINNNRLNINMQSVLGSTVVNVSSPATRNNASAKGRQVKANAKGEGMQKKILLSESQNFIFCDDHLHTSSVTVDDASKAFTSQCAILSTNNSPSHAPSRSRNENERTSVVSSAKSSKTERTLKLRRLNDLDLSEWESTVRRLSLASTAENSPTKNGAGTSNKHKLSIGETVMQPVSRKASTTAAVASAAAAKVPAANISAHSVGSESAKRLSHNNSAYINVMAMNKQSNNNNNNSGYYQSYDDYIRLHNDDSNTIDGVSAYSQNVSHVKHAHDERRHVLVSDTKRQNGSALSADNKSTAHEKNMLNDFSMNKCDTAITAPSSNNTPKSQVRKHISSVMQSKDAEIYNSINNGKTTSTAQLTTHRDMRKANSKLRNNSNTNTSSNIYSALSTTKQTENNAAHSDSVKSGQSMTLQQQQQMQHHHAAQMSGAHSDHAAAIASQEAYCRARGYKGKIPQPQPFLEGPRLQYKPRIDYAKVFDYTMESERMVLSPLRQPKKQKGFFETIFSSGH